MPLNNMAKYCMIKENYFIDWGGTHRQHDYSTRTIITTPFVVPLRENRFHSKTTKYILPRLWNEIPTELKSINDHAVLNTALKKHYSNVNN